MWFGPPVTGSVILALFLAGYLGQQYLPPPKPKVIGLDLGTTFCSVGVFHPGSGEVEVMADEEGRKSIPSAVSFTTTAVLAGHEAVDLADTNPQNTIYDAKRFIGKIFESELLEQESARYPFKVRHAGGEEDTGGSLRSRETEIMIYIIKHRSTNLNAV